MTKSKWATRLIKAILWIAPGATLLGTSCGAEVRASLIGAGADFAGDSLSTILQALIPVEDLVGAEG